MEPGQTRDGARGVGGFVWGAATSAFQVEGGAREGGRGPSIWDTFATRPGAIEDGTDGQVACDHFHRYPEDVALLAELGVDAYRLSVSWPRVLPTGVGATSAAGLDFYDRLVDALCAAGIAPWVTLYHWDLPEALQQAGGWAARSTVDAFADYAALIARRLGDRVTCFVTQNEPWCAAILGHLEGVHAPGHQDGAEALVVAHHLLLGHGLATQAVRRERPGARVGLSHLYLHVEAAGPQLEAAARELDGVFNRFYLDPLHGRGYPEDVLAHYEGQGFLPNGLVHVRPGDLELIAAPADFLGVNYYTRARLGGPAEGPLTEMGWEVYPDGLRQALLRIHRDYGPPSLVVTESGAAFADAPDVDGVVHDAARVRYLEAHSAAALDARAAGAPVEGYFVWSLLDNFEWAFGYTKRFGLVRVDFDTRARTLKDSGRWYRDAIAAYRAAEGGR